MPQKIIDTHVHVWDLAKARYDWLDGDTTIINRSFHIEELADARLNAGVTEGVLVQSGNNFEDTNHMLQVAENCDWITGVVGWLPLQDPDKTEKALHSKYLSNSYFKGVRHLIHNEANAEWLLQEKVIESLQIIAGYNLTYDIVGINDDHIKTILKLVEKVPDLKMVFDHINQPPVATKEQFGSWGTLMKEASKHPNLFVKISGLGTTVKKPFQWTAEDVKPYVAFAIEQFGVQRCFCGSDWPVSLLAESYINTWAAYRSIIQSLLSTSDQDKVFYQNAVNFYNLQ